MESVENNQDAIMAKLKLQADEIGVKYTHNMKEETLQANIDKKLEDITKKQEEKKAAKEKLKAEPIKKTKVIITPRDNDDNITDQFFAIHSMKTGVKESIQVMFDEEVELSDNMIEHIKSVGGKVKKFKMKPDADGIPMKQWYDVWKSRFIVEKV